jgi:glycosyltransferase involved in cell wall biosynthesis
MNPEISVVMPVYNGQNYLNEAIESILKQTFKNFEFIIINDGSVDRSREIAESFSDCRIRFLDQKNSGVAIALNNAIRISKAPFIARMDADDIALPNRLETQLSFLKNNPDYILVGSNATIIDMNGDFVYTSKLPTTWDGIESKLPDSSFFHSSVLFDKNSFDKAGGYFESISKFNCFEDAILWNKMKKLGKMANLEQALICYRLAPGSVTTKSGKEARIIYKIYREIVDTNKLSSRNFDLLNKIKLLNDDKHKEFNYYIHLTKKYLWNNNNPSKARQNLYKSFKVNPFALIQYFLLLLSILPKNIIIKMYRSN